MSDPTKMSDSEIEKSLERFRDLLAQVEWIENFDLQFEGSNYRRNIAGNIARLEGEVERRRERTSSSGCGKKVE